MRGASVAAGAVAGVAASSTTARADAARPAAVVPPSRHVAGPPPPRAPAEAKADGFVEVVDDGDGGAFTRELDAAVDDVLGELGLAGRGAAAGSGHSSSEEELDTVAASALISASVLRPVRLANDEADAFVAMARAAVHDAGVQQAFLANPEVRKVLAERGAFPAAVDQLADAPPRLQELEPLPPHVPPRVENVQGGFAVHFNLKRPFEQLKRAVGGLVHKLAGGVDALAKIAGGALASVIDKLDPNSQEEEGKARVQLVVAPDGSIVNVDVREEGWDERIEKLGQAACAFAVVVLTLVVARRVHVPRAARVVR